MWMQRIWLNGRSLSMRMRRSISWRPIKFERWRLICLTWTTRLSLTQVQWVMTIQLITLVISFLNQKRLFKEDEWIHSRWKERLTLESRCQVLVERHLHWLKMHLLSRLYKISWLCLLIRLSMWMNETELYITLFMEQVIWLSLQTHLLTLNSLIKAKKNQSTSPQNKKEAY